MAISRRFSDQFAAFCQQAGLLAERHHAEAILILVDRPTDWGRLVEAVGPHPTVIIAADTEDALAGADEASLETLVLADVGAAGPSLGALERLTEALLDAVSDELIAAGATVVAAYSAFEAGAIDTLSLIRLDEHLGRLTIRDLRQLDTKVPTETLKLVVDLAVEIGREGREGQPVGTLFVVGDHRRVQSFAKPMGFDAVRGYKESERSLADAKTREGVKEVAQMDGAFIISDKGIVVAASQHIAAPPAEDIALSKGLGARHWAAAQITRATSAVAVAVSQSSGTVRVFKDGDVELRIEPFRRAMTWRDLDDDPAPAPAATPDATADPPKPEGP